MASSDDIAEILDRLQRGERGAIEALTPSLYGEMRRLAAGYLRTERAAHTLQPTALVHEAYLRLVHQRNLDWKNRAQILGVAAQLMRHILVDHARARARLKRSGLVARVTLDDEAVGAVEHDVDLVALDTALRELAEMDEQLSRVVELRYFGGLTVDEVAEVLAVSPRSVDRAWATARAWLRQQIEERAGM
jgi:RNA polymerase sigma factor (TIGR02999 family)